jgi:hypothetical protein
MTSVTAKDTIRRFFSCFETGDPAATAAFIADDVSWWVQGRGVADKAAICANHAFIMGSTSARKMKIVGEIAEGDRVAVEVDSELQFKDGRTLHNTMHVAFTLRDGKISAVREYMDTAALAQFMQG